MEDLFALMGEGHALEQDQLTGPAAFGPPSGAGRARGNAAGFDARHYGTFQDMNKAEFQTSGKRRYDTGVGGSVLKVPRTTPDAYGRADV